MWWRITLRMRREKARRAERPLIWMTRIACTVAALIAAFLAESIPLPSRRAAEIGLMSLGALIASRGHHPLGLVALEDLNDMPKPKSTLKIDNRITAKAKRNADPTAPESGRTPVLNSFRGVLCKVDIGAYRKHLAEKYRSST